MHKNKLQEYVQKSGMPLPVYHTNNEGFAHAPKFRSTVVVNGKEYNSRKTYLHRKKAEQDVAELALKNIMDDINNNDECTILPDVTCCKSILHEYAVKKNLSSPQYVTTKSGGLYPVFVCTLVFNHKSYIGQVCKSKKEAEQLAAFVTVQSLLESNSCGHLHQIIKSKLKMSGKSHQANHPLGINNLYVEDSLKQGSTMNILGQDSTTNLGDKNKRKLDNFNSESKRMREYGPRYTF